MLQKIGFDIKSYECHKKIDLLHGNINYGADFEIV